MVRINTVKRDAPWGWLKDGWTDFMRAPGLSLAFGVFFVAVGLSVTGGLHLAGMINLAPVALSGFALVAPALALGIYRINRAIDRGDKPGFKLDLSSFPGRRSQIGLLAVLLLLLFLIWARAAQFIFVIFAPSDIMTPMEFLNWSLTSGDGLTFLAVGSTVGFVLAFTAFTISALSFPMLVDQDVDAVTAMMASIRAVAGQPFVMITWAWIIAFMIIVGVVTFGLGLAVTFPWIAHASWRAYQDFAPEADHTPAVEA
jgi:uncharacterized membrane protein